MNIIKQFLAFVTFIFGLNREIQNVKKKHYLSSVYITKNCELCISLITQQLTINFWLTIWNALPKPCKHLKLEINFVQNRGYVPLYYTSNIKLTSFINILYIPFFLFQILDFCKIYPSINRVWCCYDNHVAYKKNC